MAPDIEDHQRRYRRRIIGVGAGLFVLTFAIPAPFMLDRVEGDLERRVTDELAAASIDGVAVSFSGQDGSLTCADPLDDPEFVVGLAEDEWGVRRIALGPGCGAGGASASSDPDADRDDAGDDDTLTGADDSTADSTVDGDDLDPPPTAVSTTVPASTVAPSTTAPPLDSIQTLIANDPQFSQLAGLFASSATALGPSTEGPVTVFAPTDAAFDAVFDELGSDAFAALIADPTSSEQLLAHHITAGRLTTADLTELAPGDLEMLDGTSVQVGVDATGLTLTSAGVEARPDPDQAAFVASNGVVHAIDTVLLPGGLGVEPVPAPPLATVTVASGRYTFAGRVADESQRATLVGALDGLVDPANIVDLLTVEEGSPLPPEEVDDAAALLATLPLTLASGSLELADGSISLDGVVAGDAQRARIVEAASSIEASVTLVDPEIADADRAQELEDDLAQLVSDEPIRFEPNSADLADEAAAVIERLAGRIIGVTGVAIVVVGHTDSDGQAATNQQLSEDRAEAVRAALVERGVDERSLSSEGRGGSEPILVDGAEDKDASRRVEFLVVLPTPPSEQ